jgi:hypothetical protein
VNIGNDAKKMKNDRIKRKMFIVPQVFHTDLVA